MTVTRMRVNARMASRFELTGGGLLCLQTPLCQAIEHSDKIWDNIRS